MAKKSLSLVLMDGRQVKALNVDKDVLKLFADEAKEQTKEQAEGCIIEVFFENSAKCFFDIALADIDFAATRQLIGV